MTMSINVLMEDMICGTCSVVFAMPKNLYQNRLDKGGTFYCPNGHELHFIETTVAKLQKQLSAATTREQAEREQRLAAEAERDRLKQRTLKNGVCPCQHVNIATKADTNCSRQTSRITLERWRMQREFALLYGVRMNAE